MFMHGNTQTLTGQTTKIAHHFVETYFQQNKTKQNNWQFNKVSITQSCTLVLLETTLYQSLWLLWDWTKTETQENLYLGFSGQADFKSTMDDSQYLIYTLPYQVKNLDGWLIDSHGRILVSKYRTGFVGSGFETVTKFRNKRRNLNHVLRIPPSRIGITYVTCRMLHLTNNIYIPFIQSILAIKY